MKELFKRLLCLCLVTVLCLPACLGVLSLIDLRAEAAVSNTYQSELWLKTDYEYCLVNGQKYKMAKSATPYAYETGTVYIPLSAVCKYTGSTYTFNSTTVDVKLDGGVKHTLVIGKTEWSGGEFLLPVVEKNSEIYVSILSAKDIFGLGATFYNDEIGLVVLSRGASLPYKKDYSSLRTQIDTLSNLLFDRPSSATIFRDLMAKSGSAKNHPRILADQQTFDRLSAIVNSTEELDEDTPEQYALAVRSYTDGSIRVYSSLFTEDENGEVVWISDAVRQSIRQPYYIYDENGNRLVGQSSYSYVDEDGKTVNLTCDGSGRGDGYDVGGRLAAIATQTTKLKRLAFAWQMTGEKKYADAFYLLAVELGKWEHWGEGHFLNVADGAVEFAIGFDWIYHAYDEDVAKRNEIASILFEKGLMMGYYSILFDSAYYTSKYSDGSSVYYDGMTERPKGSYGDYLHVSAVAGTGGWRTINRENNWQTVCGSGMIISALALMEYTAYSDEAKFVIQSYLRSNEKCLLQYAPDGSYIESPGYWGYGTNTLVLTLAALESSCGTDYGLGNIIGLRDSFYFALGIASSDYEMWGYHDCGNGSPDYKSLYFMSRFYGDETLAAIRDRQLFERGKSLDLLDILYYDPALSAGADVENLNYDYNFLGIDTATFRSSWDSGAVFTGIHAGPGNVTHGDMDSGNFTLSMSGINWIQEPGTEDYNVKNFWSSGASGGYKRYRLYGKSVEGHSTIVIRDRSVAPLGQVPTTFSDEYPRINTFHSDELGGYAVTDMKVQYGANCTGGLRGVLLTNSRSTVVLQDRITFSKETPLTSVFNVQGLIELSDDARQLTATVWKNGEECVLRMTLLSENTDLKFEKMAADKTIFGDTVIRENADDKGYLYPKQRVVINADYVLEYDVAVVFEMIRHEDEVVGYEKVDIEDWKTVSDEWVKEANKDVQYETPVYKYKLSDFVKAVMRLQNAHDYKEFGEIIRETYVYTTDYDKNNKNLVKKVEEYMTYVNEYLTLVKEYNALFKNEFLD